MRHGSYVVYVLLACAGLTIVQLGLGFFTHMSFADRHLLFNEALGYCILARVLQIGDWIRDMRRGERPL